jgi:hypothetical protein
MNIKSFRGNSVGVLAVLSVAAVLAGCGGSGGSSGAASEADASATPSVDASASPSVTGSSPAAVVANTAVVSGSATTPVSAPVANGSSSSNSPATTSSIQAVTLSWAAPTENTNGTALTNLAGYVIYYGTSATSMTQQINVNTVGMLVYEIPNLASGNWYFQIMSVNAAGVQSSPSPTVTATI